MSRLSFVWRSLTALFVGFCAIPCGCSVIVNSDLNGSGIGVRCDTNDQCHAGICDRNICVASCSSSAECPAPSACFAGKCQLPLKVTALWVGVVAGGEGWTLTH